MSRNAAKSRQISLYTIVALLLTLGIGWSVQRHSAYDIPWVPDTNQIIWSIEARVEFIGDHLRASSAVSPKHPHDLELFFAKMHDEESLCG